MTRQEAISHIESLFPPDAPYESTAERGRQLLEQAKREVEGWKNESDEVLIRFAQLCIEEEKRQADRAMRSNRNTYSPF